MDKEQIAIMRLKEASKMSLEVYKQPLVVTTSGGKDSSVCVELALRAKIPFEVMHNHTTADAPETVYFVRNEFKRLELKGIKCKINMPVYKRKSTSMWSLIPEKVSPPTRLFRFCCSVLKEKGGEGRFITTGVRWAESESRKKNRGIYESGREIILSNDNDEKRMLFENCKLKAKRVCNPIIDWSDEDVWDFLWNENIIINPLYSCGYSRVGCIGCPMAGTKGRQEEFKRYPKYKKMYIKSFEKMIEERKKRGIWKEDTPMGHTGEDVFHWWMEDGVLPGQFKLWDEVEE